MFGIIQQYMDYLARQNERRRFLTHEEVNVQNNRSSNLVGSGPERQLQSAREATRRVGEYKEGERNHIMKILDEHADKNFVQRIISPEDSPRLYDNPGGQMGKASTHSMAWGTEDGNAFVYPTVIQNPQGDLQRLGKKEAWQHAKDTNERIPFGEDHDRADWFSRQYKKVWGDGTP